MIKKERAIVRLHLVYGLVILAILAVFLLVIVPGQINERAFDNFCFASTIVSIVLAVVSIVFSFRTKNNASDNLAGIREVERGIDERLKNFDELEKHILAGLETALQSGINPLRDDQVGIRDSIEQLKEEMRQQSSANVSRGSQSDQKNKIVAPNFSTNSFLGDVALYIACQSFKTKKAIDLPGISESLAQRRDYLFGFLVAIVVAFPRHISFKSKSGNSVIEATITEFDSDLFGDESTCRRRVEEFKDKDVVKECLDAIDAFFANN